MKPELLLRFSCLIFFFLGCRSSQKNVHSYIEKNGEVIKTSIPYEIASKIEYTKDLAPYLICIREEVAKRTSNFELHWQHIEPREYYASIFKVETDTFDSLSDAEFKAEIEELFEPVFGKKEIEVEGAKILVASMTQKMDRKKAFVNYNNTYRYLLKKSVTGWKINGIEKISN